MVCGCRLLYRRCRAVSPSFLGADGVVGFAPFCLVVRATSSNISESVVESAPAPELVAL